MNRGIRILLMCGIFLLAASNYIYAATVTAIGSGDYDDPGNWDTGEVPGQNDSVIVEAGYSINITADDTFGSLTVYSEVYDNSTVLIYPGVTLTVNNNVKLQSYGPGMFDEPISQIRLYGTLSVRGDLQLQTTAGTDPSFAVIKMLYVDGSILELYGDVQVSGAGGQIDAINSKSTTVKFLGSGNQYMRVTNEIEYFNVIIDKDNSTDTVTLDGTLTSSLLFGNITIQNGTFDNGGYNITGNDSSFTVKSGTTFILSGSSSLPVSLNHVFESGSTISYLGSTTVGTPNNSQEYQTLLISGTGTKTLGGNISVSGNLTITSGTLDADNIGNYNIALQGNWINTGGSFTARQGTVTFNGSSDQAITSNDQSFYNLTINNTATQVTLNDDVSVSGTLTLTNGVVTTGSNNLIITNTAASSITGFTNGSFVNGNLRRYLASNTDTYSFPVGNGTGTSNYYRADIINGSMTGTSYITGSFGALHDHSDEDMHISDAWLDYNTINTAGIWTLSPDIQPTGGDYDVRLYIENFSGLTDNLFAVLKRPEGSTSGADWTDGGGTLNADDGDGRLVSDGYMLRMGLSGFSEFGGGGGTPSGGGLPIELLSFDASLDNQVVNLTWVTATEINNDFFTLERSKDGEHFETVAQIDGAGNSAQKLVYRSMDSNPYNGISYYRLKQTDFDGEFSYSKIDQVVNGKTPVNNINVNVFPNPVVDKLNISLNGLTDAAKVEAYLKDLSGRVLKRDLFNPSDVTRLSMDLPPHLAKGMYFLELRVNNGVIYQQKVYHF